MAYNNKRYILQSIEILVFLEVVGSQLKPDDSIWRRAAIVEHTNLYSGPPLILLRWDEHRETTRWGYLTQNAVKFHGSASEQCLNKLHILGIENIIQFSIRNSTSFHNFKRWKASFLLWNDYRLPFIKIWHGY